MEERKITVLLVENDAMVREWLRSALTPSEFRIAGEAATAAEALELAHRRHADLLLVDYHLADGTGTELIRALRQRGLATPALIMTASNKRGMNEAVREAGAQGGVLKTGRIDEILAALRAVVAGENVFDARHPRRPSEQPRLSPREREIVRLIAAGRTNRDIAAELGVSGETVKTLVARTFAKLGVSKRAEAVAVAHELELL